MSHTPGPWRLSERRDPASGSPVYSVLADKYLWLADVLAAEMDVGAANARLIACAPELLHELAMAVAMLRSCARTMRLCADMPLSADVVEDRADAAELIITKATSGNQ